MHFILKAQNFCANISDGASVSSTEQNGTVRSAGAGDYGGLAAANPTVFGGHLPYSPERTPMGFPNGSQDGGFSADQHLYNYSAHSNTVPFNSKSPALWRSVVEMFIDQDVTNIKKPAWLFRFGVKSFNYCG